MKYCLTFGLILLLLPILAIAAPPPQASQVLRTSHNPSPKYAWHFNIFKNKHCNDPAISISGTGSSECRTELPKGGAVAFIKVGMDPHCKVTLYKDSNCSRKDEIGNIQADSKNVCAAARKKHKHIKSYKVHC